MAENSELSHKIYAGTENSSILWLDLTARNALASAGLADKFSSEQVKKTPALRRAGVSSIG